MPRGFQSTRSKTIAGIIWVTLAFAALGYQIQGTPPLRAAFFAVSPLATALLYALLMVGIGHPLARLMAAGDGVILQGVTSLALGMGLTALCTFVLGVTGKLHTVALMAWIALGLPGLFHCARRWIRPLPPLPEGSWTPLALLVLALFVGALLPFLVAPDVSVDTLGYHLLLPKIYLTRGGIEHLPWFVQSNYPCLAEYVYLPLLAATGEEPCKAFHFWVAVALMLLMAETCRWIDPAANPLLAPALFASMPVVAIHVAWAWNDFMFTLFLFLALRHLLAYDTAGPMRSIAKPLLSGLLFGLAAFTKYTFVQYLLPFALIVAWGLARRAWSLRHAGAMVLGVALLAAPWMGKNWAFTGNPVYPFLRHVFPSPEWTEATDAHMLDAIRLGEFPSFGWPWYLTFPVKLTLTAHRIETHVGAVPLLLLPFLFVPLRAPASVLRAFVALATLSWLWIHAEVRSLLTMFAVYLCLVGSGLQTGARMGRIGRTMLGVAIVGASIINLSLTLVTAHYLFDPIAYFIGKESRAQYLERMAPGQRAFSFLNALPSARKVLLVSIHEPYYLERPHEFSSFGDTPVAERWGRGARSAGEIRFRLLAAGFSHIAIDFDRYELERRNKLYAWSESGRRMFEELLTKECRPLRRFGSQAVYAIGPPAVGPPSLPATPPPPVGRPGTAAAPP